MLTRINKRVKFIFYPHQAKTYLPNFFYSMTSFLRPKGLKTLDHPPFHLLNNNLIKQNTGKRILIKGINPYLTYLNSIFWTPKFYIQKDISDEFLWELKKFRKLGIWNDSDYLALTQVILTEAIRDTTFEIAYNYKAEPTNFCQFNGNIDILLYNNDFKAK